MQQLFAIAALWLAFAVVAAVIANRIKIAIALVEICVGVVVAADRQPLRRLRQAGLERALAQVPRLDRRGAAHLPGRRRARPRRHAHEAHGGLGRGPRRLRRALPRLRGGGALSPRLGRAASLLAGVALSTTSMAVVYAVMLETGFNRTEFGKGILGACFVNDLGTVIALGLIFAPFTWKTVVFIVAAPASSPRYPGWSTT